MTKEIKILSAAFIAVNLVIYLAMAFYNTSFNPEVWNGITKAFFSGSLVATFVGVVYWILFKD